MEQITITSVTPGDIDQLQNISKQTFLDTYAAGNTPENMTRYLAEHFSKEKLAAELNNPDAAFYFATTGNQVAGYIKLNSGVAQTEIQDNNALEIERIYVRKAFQGKKIGQLLYEKAIQVAKEQNAHYIWLGVWEKNERAMQFYTKNGFVPFDKHVFTLGDDEQTDIMMKLALREG